MKKFAALTLSIFMTYGIALADTPKDADPEPGKAAKAAKAPKAKAAKSAEKESAAFAAELEELRQTLQAQQEQLQLLKEELAKRDRQIDEARDAAATANTRAIEASSRATAAVSASAEVKSAASSLNSTVSDLKLSNESLRTSVATAQAQEKKVEETGPTTIRYKGITITPGGFIEAATVTRTRANSADINTSFTNIPFPGNSLSKVSETNFTARQSRATALSEGTIGTAKLTGNYEGDFLHAGVTSTNRKSINNRQEWVPMMIDPQYVVGFTWARQYGFRVVKDFGGKFALGLSVEGPQATLGGRGFTSLTSTTALGAVTTAQNFFINAPGQAGGLLNAFDATGYTVNK